MKNTIKTTLAAIALATAGATNATAQYVTKMLPTYNATAQEQKVTMHHIGPQSFGFLDMWGSEGNLENFYGEAGFQPITKEGFGVRGEVNFGNNYEDTFRPQFTYTPDLKDGFVTMRLSPTNTTRAEQQLTTVFGKQVGPVNIKGFVDINHYQGNWSRVSDVNASVKLSDNINAFVRQEHRPWTQPQNAYLIGIEAKL